MAEVTVFDRHLSETEAPAALAGYDILCLLRERMALPGALLRSLPDLRMIACTGPHNRTLDLETAPELGIAVSCTDRPPVGANPTAAPALGLILSVLIRLPQDDASSNACGLPPGAGDHLEGKTMGICRSGRTGS